MHVCERYVAAAPMMVKNADCLSASREAAAGVWLSG